MRKAPNFHRAKVQLALYDFRNTRDLDRSIARLERILREARFENQEALVGLAALQMQRNGAGANADGANDQERARKNLQRALAIDDGYMPALNQLAVYYLRRAQPTTEPPRRLTLTGATAPTGRANAQQLELAALVASQAIAKNRSYAPIHNTAGLVFVELSDFNRAVEHFAEARRLDPRFLEAHLNYAAVSLSFRGYQQAELAYRDALRLAPESYEAHLGLALALRGQLRPGADSLMDQVQAELDAAKRLAPARAETYYNEAIFVQEFRAKTGERAAIPALQHAARLYRQFVQRAGTAPRYAEAVRRAEERAEDIARMVRFIEGRDP